MGKSLKSSEQSSAVQIQDNNPGCMWGMFHILDYHHWRIKKVFHHKKKRHARYKRNTISHDQQQDVVAEAEAEPLLVSQHEEKLNATTSGECALHQKKDGSLNLKPKEANKLSRDISVKIKNNSDVLEIISVEKNLLLKLLQDIDNGGNKSRRASRNKANLTKSGSFPLTASSSNSSSSSSGSTLRNKQNEIWAFPKGEKLRVGTQAPKMFGSNSVKDKKPKPSVTDSGVEQKPNISLKSSEGLNHKGWNQLVIHQFKVIKQKIKHALVEIKKSGHHHTSVEDIHNKASTEYSNDNNEKEISEILDDDVIRAYRKSKSLSESKVSDFDSNKHETRLMRRTSSLHESLDKYTQLFERSLSKEAKWRSSKSKSLRLISEDKIQKNGHAPVFSRSNLSMPNIEFLGFILHEAILDTVETDNNDGQKKLVSLSSEIDKSLDQVKEAEIAEEVQGSGRDGEDESFPQEKVGTSMEDITLSLESIYQNNTTFHAEGRERSTLDSTLDELDSLPDSLSNTNASVKAKDANKSLDNHIQLFISDIENDSNFKYVKDVLEFSGFMGNDQMRYTVEQPLKPTLFKALEASLNHEKESSGEEIINIYDHHQLLFNLVNEVIFETHENSPCYFPRPLFFSHQLHPMPKGQYLLKEVWSGVSSYLSLRPELFQTLDDVVSHDLAKRSGWMNTELQQEEEIVALELEEMIIDDLLDEIVFSAYD